METISSIIHAGQPVSGVYMLIAGFPEGELKILADNPFHKIYYIEGSQIYTRQKFLDTMQVVMNAPEHCKYNWDTLLDCMRGVERPSSPIDKCIFIYDSIGVFAKRNMADFQIAIDVMQDAAETWRNRLPQKRMYIFLIGDQNIVGSIPVLDA